jgi:putative salt-induced outer membrane protein YdiY
MHTRISRSLPISLFLATILLPGFVSADQLVMKNGDVITGDIGKIENDKVFIKPAYGSEFSVDLAEVVSIDAEKVFEVELEDGREMNAKIAGSAAEGEQTLIVDGAQMAVGTMAISQAAQPEPWYKRTSHIDLNVTRNSGNTDSKSNLLFADTRLRMGDHRHLAELTIARDKTNDVSTKKQDLFRYSYNWLVNDPWYLGATASYERDPIKDLDHRYMVGALLGRDLIKDSRKFLTASIGMGYSDEKLAGISDSGATGLWNLIYEHDFRDGSIAFFHNQNLNYQFYGDNNMILKTNTGFRFDIVSDVYASISYRYDYESEPAADTKDYDSTLAIGIGASF